MTHLTYGSVCSGIEAATIAWHPLGMRAAWFSEIEGFPSAVLAYHYPTVPNLGDMRKIARLILTGQIEAPDVLVGGTPCQAFSVAGLREGLEDERGQLTITYFRLLDAIDFIRGRAGKQPAIAVWENVPGVLSDKTNAFGCFLAGLAGEDIALEPPGKKWANAGCVYGPKRAVAWRVMDAQYAGVAQRRRRVFVVASARKGFDPSAILFEFDGVRRDTAPSREAWKDASGAAARGAGACGVAGTLAASTGGADENDAADGRLVPDVARCLTTNNQRIDAETETFIVQPPIAFSSKDYGNDAAVEIAPTMRAMGHTGSHQNGGGQLAVAMVVHGTQDPCVGDDIAFALGRNNGGENAVAYSTSGAGYWRDGIGALRARPQDSHENVVCVTGDVTHTLKAEGFDASADGTGRGQPITTAYGFQQRIARNGRGDMGDVCSALTAQAGETGKGDAAPCVATEMAVRRLTPVECERLQGFPDGYTSIPSWDGWRKMDASETPESCLAEGLEIKQNPKTLKWRVKDVDGPRYKALGNSMAVPCMAWIGRRVLAYVNGELKKGFMT